MLLVSSQPVNVGYSHAREPIRTLDDAISNMHLVLQRILTAFPQYLENEFFIAGESYGGIWVPNLAARILERQRSDIALTVAATTNETIVPLNLKGIILVNALMSESLQRLGHYELACLGSSPIFNSSVCGQWASQQAHCAELQSACEFSENDPVICFSSKNGICSEFLGWITSELGRNPYNIKLPCEGGELCYDFSDLEVLQSSKDFQEALGVDKDADYQLLDYELYDFFQERGEVFIESIDKVSFLLDEVGRPPIAVVTLVQD